MNLSYYACACMCVCVCVYVYVCMRVRACACVCAKCKQAYMCEAAKSHIQASKHPNLLVSSLLTKIDKKYL